ncbi:MAG: phosphate acyltransferase PlsX [Planctomycetes bacterium]|nr:phosphate acyltransferase PlsX [Planctomycetota bacterium]
MSFSASQRIALDVMGGDNAPLAVLQGALQAVAEDGPWKLPAGRVLLVGDQAVIHAFLDAHGARERFLVQHASEVIGMAESPATALRAKPDASINVCVKAVKSGAAGAIVSMGNTGAVVGASTLGLGTLAGVKRPGIAVTLKLTQHPITILDMGAHIAPKAQHLVQYGLMGAVYARDCLGIANPRVGLLNIGEEASKGTDLLKEAYPLLAASKFDFVGNVESSGLFKGVADVIVTDGFTGNVVLKLMEEFSGFILKLVLGELKAHSVQWGPEALGKIKKHIDYAEYGGALLLGVQGIVVKGHGRSDANAVSNALVQALRALDAGVNQHIVQGLAEAGATVES